MLLTLTLFISFMGGFLAACLTSFAFVAGERPMRNESVVHTSSHCISCGTDLRLIDNIPVFGWLLNRGKAHCCGSPIPSQFFWMELITGLMGGVGTYYLLTGTSPSYFSDSWATIYLTLLMIMVIAVWWRWETVREQIDTFNPYILPPIEYPVDLNTNQYYVYTRAVLMNKDKGNPDKGE